MNRQEALYLENKHGIKPGADLTEEQIEWLKRPPHKISDEDWCYLNAFFALTRLLAVYGYTSTQNYGALQESFNILVSRQGLDDLDGVLAAIRKLVLAQAAKEEA